MFFGQSEELDVKSYIKEQWINLSEFSENISLEKNLLLVGYGFFKHDSQSQFNESLGYYLLKLNDRVFGIGGTGETLAEGSPITFKHVNEFDPKILTSAIFDSQFTESNNYHKNFDAELTVEAKIYPYADEEKLLISKKGQGNIDLYCSYQVRRKDNDLIAKIYPTAFSAAKHLAMNRLLDERIKNLKK